MKYRIFFFVVLGLALSLFGSSLFAQKETYNWYFGDNSGITFLPNGTNPKPLPGGKITSDEGVASISDSDGNLLFYTNGNKIWNKNHYVMMGGNNLNGDPSATQSSVIVPKPGSNSVYYVFTVSYDGFMYATVDMNANSGEGAVIAQDVMLNSNATEKITAVRNSSGKGVWVINKEFGNNEFEAYLVTADGVSTNPVVSAVGSIHSGSFHNKKGFVKFSPDGKKMACTVMGSNFLEIFDFDAESGILSNPIKIQDNSEYRNAYGIEFSPDCSKLYLGTTDQSPCKVYQFDLSVDDEVAIRTSSKEIYSQRYYVGSLQLGPDDRIYIGRWDYYLAVITNPNELFPACNFVADGVNLGGPIGKYGLPNFVQSFFADSPPPPPADTLSPKIDFSADECFENVKISVVDGGFAESGIDEIVIVYENNCRLVEIERSDSTAKFGVEIIDRTKDAGFKIIAVDNNGNATEIERFMPAAVVSVTYAGRADSLDFDSAEIGSVICRDVTLHNFGGDTVTIEALDLRFNVEFSVPDDQFAIEIPPRDSAVATICFRPLKADSVYRDTLRLETLCFIDALPLVGLGDTVFFDSRNRCEARILISLDEVSEDFDILGVFPNPAVDETRIVFYLPESRPTRVILRDAFGEPMPAIFEGRAPAGVNEITAPLGEIKSGVYFLEINAGGEVVREKIIAID